MATIYTALFRHIVLNAKTRINFTLLDIEGRIQASLARRGTRFCAFRGLKPTAKFKRR